jgi:hypothetical protein
MTPPHSPPAVAVVATIAPEHSIYSDVESHSPTLELAAPAQTEVEVVQTVDSDGGSPVVVTRLAVQLEKPQTLNPAQRLLPKTFGIPRQSQRCILPW